MVPTQRWLTCLRVRAFVAKIAVDVVSFGEIEDNQAKLEGFLNAVNSDNNRSTQARPRRTERVLMSRYAAIWS
jgi:hypothetical protein